MTSTINKQIAIGAGWMVSLRWVNRVMRIISIAILARLLLPTDFGLVAYALVFLSILDEFFMFSFQTVLIRDQDASKEKYSTVWTLEIIKGVAVALLLVVSAKWLADFFNEPQVQTICYWIAATPLLKGFINIGTVDFQKNLELHKDFYFDLIAGLGGTITTLVLALLLRNYWALVYGSIVQAVLRVILSYIMSDFRPRLCLSEYARVFGFSKWLLVQNIFSSMNKRLPSIVIGRYFSAEPLAFFNMSKELSGLASEEFASPIRRALYPGITKMQNDHAQMAHTLKMSIGIIVMIGLPATIGIGVTAPLLIPAFLGSNWIEAAPIVTVLSFFFASFIFYPNSHVIYYALNRPKITAYISMLRLFLLAPALIIFVPDYGAIGAAWALTFVSWLLIVVDYLVLFRMTEVTLSGVIAHTWRCTLAVMVMAFCVIFALENPMTASMQQSLLLHLLYCISVGLLSYVVMVPLLWRLSGMPDGPEAYAFRLLKKILNRR